MHGGGLLINYETYQRAQGRNLETSQFHILGRYGCRIVSDQPRLFCFGYFQNRLRQYILQGCTN